MPHWIVWTAMLLAMRRIAAENVQMMSLRFQLQADHRQSLFASVQDVSLRWERRVTLLHNSLAGDLITRTVTTVNGR